MKRLLTIAATTLLALGGAIQARAQQQDGMVQIADNWYRYFLGRPVDQAGVDYWVPRLNSQGPQPALAGMLASDEYYNRNGGTPQGMVLGLYRDVLNRTGLQQQDVDYWVNKMAQYGSRETMIQEFLRDANVNVSALGAAQAAVPAPPPVAPPATAFAPPAQVYTPPTYAPPAPSYPFNPNHHWHRAYHYRPW